MRCTLLSRSIEAMSTLLARRRQIRYRAFHDELTGLPNRYLFSDRLEQALSRAMRHPPGFAVVYVDVDGFKAVNDRFGHWAGDELLKHVGSCLAAGLGAQDTAARIGGDEFALLLLRVDDAAMVRTAVCRIEAALRRPVSIDGRELSVSCSIGFSIFPQDGADASMLLRRADMAMYDHKNGGALREAMPRRPPGLPAGSCA